MSKLCERITVPMYAVPMGALVLIQWPGTKYAQHAALCTGANLIHCCGIMGKVVEHGYRGLWLERTRSIWWIPGVSRG